MRTKLLTLMLLFISVSLNAQLYFHPEFGVYRLNSSDQLRSLTFFSPDSSSEFIYGGFYNKPENIFRVVKYNFKGTFLEHKSFPLRSSEEYISGKLFNYRGRTFFISVTAFTADTVLKYDSVYQSTEIRSSNYLSFNFYDFESKQLLDSTRILIGGNYKFSYSDYSFKLEKLNFITIPFPDAEPTNVYIGVIFNDRRAWSYLTDIHSTHIFKVSFDGSKILQTIKTDNCGNDFYRSDSIIISSGFRRYAFYAMVSEGTNDQYIIKTDNEFVTVQVIYKLQGNLYQGKNTHNYVKYFSDFNGLFNNFPENSMYNPLFWYAGNDTHQPEWNGPYFYMFTKDFTRLKYPVYGAFYPKTMNDAHTYIKLSDSSDALLYFTKDDSIITYWVRRISDGKLIYFDSYGTLLPEYILKSTSGKQYFFESKISGVIAYVLNGEIPTSVDLHDQNDLPVCYELRQNYPNPFNGATKITYVVPEQSHIDLKIYDMLGNEITTLVSKVQSPGEYSIDFDAGSLPSGVYICSIRAGNFYSAKKLTLLK